MKKLLSTLVLFATLALTACGGAGNSASKSSSKPASHTHVWSDWTVTNATCETAGSRTRTCTGEGTCPKGNTETETIAPLGHDYSGTPTAQAAVADCINSSTVKCSRCDKYAIRWAAKDYIAAESNDLEATKSDGSFRFQTARYWTGRGNNGEVDPTVPGSSVVYYVSSYAQVTNAGFAFHIKQKSDWSGQLFATQSGDELRGQNKVVAADGTETYERAEYRYELRINDQIVPLVGEDKTDVSQGTEGWYDWPVNGFSLNSGKNKIEIICLGGYRAYMFDFQFTNLPAPNPAA